MIWISPTYRLRERTAKDAKFILLCESQLQEKVKDKFLLEEGFCKTKSDLGRSKAQDFRVITNAFILSNQQVRSVKQIPRYFESKRNFTIGHPAQYER
jgi:hypothetical protein